MLVSKRQAHVKLHHLYNNCLSSKHITKNVRLQRLVESVVWSITLAYIALLDHLIRLLLPLMLRVIPWFLLHLSPVLCRMPLRLLFFPLLWPRSLIRIHARLLMDSGASLSLITERLADALHAERHRHHVKVTGLAGGLVSKALCEFIFLFCSQPPGWSFCYFGLSDYSISYRPWLSQSQCTCRPISAATECATGNKSKRCIIKKLLKNNTYKNIIVKLIPFFC